ncbi:Enoyl-CoA hydratase/isomerase [Alcanivorax sp. S71-1-4]|uniref:enoyl-CoA hydratase-related protein n=1 Tax=Alcanivorax sp. S71-1-4 TaxID=1177159 RepID=UPI00135691DB|nr:enoyl-CoA hydratase-related protein [Alcanivorax sp. S71-1-4]KAF0809992.1 Enoyl-CoA hydratase/isomerase [Alcanivorax sp. S71-1-4]
MNSTETIAQAKALYEALATGDRDTLAALLHDDFHGAVTPGMPAGLGGEYTSADAMRREFWGRLGKLFAARAVPGRFEPLASGDLLVEGTYRGHARASGHPVEAVFMHRLTFRDGRIAALHQLTDSAQWQAALAGQTPGFETLRFSIDDGLATLCLNRPAQRNAIDLRMATELQQVAVQCRADTSLRAVLICAEGAAFTVGGDLAFLNSIAPEALPGMLTRMTSAYHQALSILADLPVPVVAAAQGAAAGGGLGLLYVADIVLAADDLRVALGFGTLGLSMDGGNGWYLPRLVGQRRAAQLYFQGRTLNADEALSWGLVSDCVPGSTLREQAGAVARQLANGPTRAYGEARRLLRESDQRSLAEHLRDETEALARSAASADVQEGIEAFLARRAPRFNGR